MQNKPVPFCKKTERKEKLKELAVEKRLDSIKIAKIRESLKETIDFFNSPPSQGAEVGHKASSVKKRK